MAQEQPVGVFGLDRQNFTFDECQTYLFVDLLPIGLRNAVQWSYFTQST